MSWECVSVCFHWSPKDYSWEYDCAYLSVVLKHSLRIWPHTVMYLFSVDLRVAFFPCTRLLNKSEWLRKQPQWWTTGGCHEGAKQLHTVGIAQGRNLWGSKLIVYSLQET